jgi:hypothetical protein
MPVAVEPIAVISAIIDAIGDGMSSFHVAGALRWLGRAPVI